MINVSTISNETAKKLISKFEDSFWETFDFESSWDSTTSKYLIYDYPTKRTFTICFNIPWSFLKGNTIEEKETNFYENEFIPKLKYELGYEF